MFKRAAIRVLECEKRFMRVKDITLRALELKLLDGLMGKTPDNTMASTLFGELKKNKRNGELIRPAPGLFGLRGWQYEKGSLLANANGSGLESDDEQLETTEREYSHEDDSEAEVEATVGWNGWRPRNKRRRRRFVNTCSTPAVARAWSEPQRDPADWLSPEPERAEQTEMGWMRAEEGGEAAPEEAVAEQTQGMETAEAAALMGLDLLLEAAGALQAQDAVPARIAAPVEEEVKTFETADWLSPRPADIAGAWEAAKLAEAQETWCSAPISLPMLVVAPPALCGDMVAEPTTPPPLAESDVVRRAASWSQANAAAVIAAAGVGVAVAPPLQRAATMATLAPSASLCAAWHLHALLHPAHSPTPRSSWAAV